MNEINLKECKYFKGVGCINSSFKFWGCTNLGGMCSEHPNCYFKQLKHKELILNSIKSYCEECNFGWLDLTTDTILAIINNSEKMI